MASARRALIEPLHTRIWASIRKIADAERALTDEWGRKAAFIGGGSIPVATEIKEKPGMDVIVAGFGLNDDRIHSPNEKHDLRCFHKGIRSWARILESLASAGHG